MKKLIIITSCLCLCLGLMAQTSGKITYEEVKQLNIDLEGIGAAGGVDVEQLKEMIPTESITTKQLIFNEDKSVYHVLEKSDSSHEVNMSNGGMQMKFKFMGDDEIDEIVYIDHSSQKSIEQKGLFGKMFLVDGNLENSKWKLTGEKIKYLDYECHKAVQESEDGKVIAWFAPSISAKVGPSNYQGLPGAILMVSIDEGDTEIRATDINFVKILPTQIQEPVKGKRVSQDEFQQIEAEKLKQFQESTGGENIIIRRGPNMN